MKKISSLMLTVAIMVLCTSTAYANTGLYLGAKAGVNAGSVNDVSTTNMLGNTSYDSTTFATSFSAGYDFDSNFAVPVRAEVEYVMLGDINGRDARWSNNLDMTFETNALMLNVYYDFNTGTMFTPYIGAGLGLAYSEIDVDGLHNGILIDGDNDNGTELAWSIGLGLGFEITESLTIDAGYRFMSLGSAATSGATTGYFDTPVAVYSKVDSLYANFFHVGIRYTF